MRAGAKLCICSQMILEEVGNSVWLAEGELVNFHGFPFPTRSVVARLDGGDLWIWSPIRLSEDLIGEVDRLGRVAHLVSPNKIHHLYLQDWAARYPEAHVWGLPSVIDKRRDLTFREPLSNDPPAEWQADLDQAWFQGSRMMDEAVFFHRPSRTVILADLIENFTEPFLREHWSRWRRALAKVDGITADNPHAPLEWRLSFLDRTPARAARDKMLGWNGERVIMAHGEWQRSGGQAFLTRAFAWLDE